MPDLTYTAPDGVVLHYEGPYALRYAVIVREYWYRPWGFYGTSRTYQGAWRKMLEARRRGGFAVPDTCAIVEANDRCPFCARDEPCAFHVKAAG